MGCEAAGMLRCLGNAVSCGVARNSATLCAGVYDGDVLWMDGGALDVLLCVVVCLCLFPRVVVVGVHRAKTRSFDDSCI